MLIYIQHYLEIYKQTLVETSKIQYLNDEDFLFLKYSIYAYKAIPCKYFFQKLLDKIYWQSFRINYKDENNNYI